VRARHLALAPVGPPAPDIALTIPTPGKILEAITQALIDGDRYDRELPERQRDTLY